MLARVTRGALVAYRTRLRFLAVELLSTAGPLCPTMCLFGTILVTLCFDGAGLVGFKIRANAFL